MGTSTTLPDTSNAETVKRTDSPCRYSNLARLVSLPRAPERKQVRRGRDRRVPPQDRRWLLERVRQLCLENRIDLVVIIPWYRVFDDHVHLLRETAQWQEVLVIDLPAALAAVPERRGQAGDVRGRHAVDDGSTLAC